MTITNNEVLEVIDGEETAGGNGYEPDVTLEDADRIVDSKSELLAMLKSNRDVIGIAGDTRIDMTGEHMIDIGDKTLVSDRGHDGSAGGLITTDSRGAYGSDYYTLFYSFGSPHISGLRVRGARHDGEFTRWDYDDNLAQAIMLRGPGGEVENCELSGWTWNGIRLKGNGTRGRTEAEIHHNHIHKSYQVGYGYGISHARGFGHIHHNYFDETRHAVDGFGWWNCGYVVENNIFGPRQYSHQIDMHCLEENRATGRVDDRHHRNYRLRAGGRMEIRNNTFLATSFGSRGINAIAIRGVPYEGAWIEKNRFAHERAPTRNSGNDQKGDAWRQVNVLSSSWDIPTNAKGWTDNIHVGDNEFEVTTLPRGRTRREVIVPRGTVRAFAEVLSRD